MTKKWQMKNLNLFLSHSKASPADPAVPNVHPLGLGQGHPSAFSCPSGMSTGSPELLWLALGPGPWGMVFIIGVLALILV